MRNQRNPEPVERKKIDVILDVNKHLQKEIKNSTYLKLTFGIVTTVGALYALGFVFKVLSFTVNNYKNLKISMKR